MAGHIGIYAFHLFAIGLLLAIIGSMVIISNGAVRKVVGIEFGAFSGQHEVIVSGGEVNRLIDGFCGEGLPAIDLAHVDLP